MNFTLGKDEDDLPAHKLFLMTASPVLHAIISKSVESGKPINLKIVGITKETMTVRIQSLQ